jgi:sulfur carrier protein ThiS
VIINVKTVGTLKSLEEGAKLSSLDVDVPDQTIVSQVMERLNLQDWEVGFVLINGTHATKDSILKDQDQLTLIAPLVGG